MAISTEEELRVAVEEAGNLLQEIQEYLTREGLSYVEHPNAKVRFPRGYIRPAEVQRKRMPFVRDSALRTNLAYTLILSDVVLWLNLRTDLWGIPREMLTKLYVFLVGNMVESITKDFLKGVCGSGFKERNKYLAEQNIIDSQLQADLDWLWDMRNRMHLFQLAKEEYNNSYDHECHMRCVETFRGLLSVLMQREHI